MILGYGERPWHPLGVALLVILLWTGLFAGLGAIEIEGSKSSGVSFFDGLYFSVVTFTTLGYGDFSPKPEYRLLAGAEAVIGAALMAVFIVCLTRKYIR